MSRTSFVKGAVLGLLSAVLLWAGLPGGGEFWPSLLVALVPFFFLIQVEQPGKRFLLGLCAGFFHFALQLYWIVIVLGRYGGLPWFFSVPAFVLLALYMACYPGVFLLLAGRLTRRLPDYALVWLLPVSWVVLDWLRSFLFTGFPWLDLGYGLWRVPLLIQTADLLGHYFITFLVVLVNSLIFFTLRKGDGFRKKLASSSLAVLLISISLIYGHYRMAQLEKEVAESPEAVIGIVQGNIDQSRKWSPEEQQRTIEAYTSNTERLLNESRPPILVVWPETALPFFPMRNSLFGRLQLLTLENEFHLLTGSPWFEVTDSQNRKVDYYNSAFALTPDGVRGDIYFKSHLVPFGEYVPLKKFLPFLAPLVENAGDFSSGSVEKPISAGGIQSGVLICFESIFPDVTRKWTAAGANVLVNLTNDAWYGRSSAPYQSMAMSVFRAVESRRSLVRAANTGISGFVDPLGRVQKSSEIFVPWAGTMEVALMDIDTVAGRYGYHFGLFCFCLVFLFLFSGRPRRRKGRLS